MKGKVGQSMAFGLPVVTTSIGAEGMLLENGRTALIADSPKAFSDAVMQLYTDEALWKEIASNALRHIEANYSVHSARSRIEGIFSHHPVSPSVDSR
jgi:glycosyltransferase involved in cell wall biosynthesis